MAAFYGKQMKEGAQWKDIKRVIGINILGGGKDELEHWANNPNEFKRHYKFQEQLHQPPLYIDGIEIVQYSLMHTPQEFKDKEQQDWFKFFKNAHYMSEEDVHVEISTKAVLVAFERSKLAELPNRIREMYDMEDGQYKQYSLHTQDRVDKGKAEGRAEGRAEGKVEGRVEMMLELIKELIDEKTSQKRIKKYLHLSDEEYEECLNLIVIESKTNST